MWIVGNKAGQTCRRCFHQVDVTASDASSAVTLRRLVRGRRLIAEGLEVVGVSVQLSFLVGIGALDGLNFGRASHPPDPTRNLQEECV